MSNFVHQRHKPPAQLLRPRELILACPALRSNVNLSRILRAASCCGLSRLITCGPARVDPKIARDAVAQVKIEIRRSLPAVLKRMKNDGYQLVGLEQTTNAQSLFEFSYQRRTLLVIGHERHGLPNDMLSLLDHVVEIPVYGMPYSHNVATAASMAIYEYCRQFPDG